MKKLLMGVSSAIILVAGVPSNAAANPRDIPTCVNDYWWAGQGAEAYRCATEHFAECVDYYWWAGEADQAWRCTVDVNIAN